MTAADPNQIDSGAWVRRARKRLAGPAKPRDWKVEDLKLLLVFRDRFTRDELLAVLDIASGKRFDNRAGIENFLRILAAHIDTMGANDGTR